MSDASWNRIECWLAENAPKIIGNLNAPASETELAAAETSLRLSFPQDVRDLYRRHNGMNSNDNHGSLFFGMHFLPLAELVENHALTDGDAIPVRAADAGINQTDILNPKWIPFAQDYGECRLCVDLAPAINGTAGQVIFTDQADNTAILVASSLDHFLATFADELDGGKYFLNQDALDDGNHFLGCIAEIDIINWVGSPKWQHLSQY